MNAKTYTASDIHEAGFAIACYDISRDAMYWKFRSEEFPIATPWQNFVGYFDAKYCVTVAPIEKVRRLCGGVQGVPA